MSLEAAGKEARVHKDRVSGPTSKVDVVLSKLPDHEADLLRSWLEDTANWSSHMITKALTSYSASQGKDYTLGHSTIDRWRILNGIKA